MSKNFSTKKFPLWFTFKAERLIRGPVLSHFHMKFLKRRFNFLTNDFSTETFVSIFRSLFFDFRSIFQSDRKFFPLLCLVTNVTTGSRLSLSNQWFTSVSRWWFTKCHGLFSIWHVFPPVFVVYLAFANKFLVENHVPNSKFT